jgi:hypothetical protein
VPKLVQPWQAYLNKFQDTKLKQDIDDAWQDYIKEVPEGENPDKTQFEVRNKVARRLYEDETLEVKQEVEEHRQKMREKKSAPDIVDRSRAFQRYLFARGGGTCDSHGVSRTGLSINSLVHFNLLQNPLPIKLAGACR